MWRLEKTSWTPPTSFPERAWKGIAFSKARVLNVLLFYLRAVNGCCVSGRLPTYRVRLRPRWLSAAAPSTLSWGLRRKKAKTLTRLVCRQEWLWIMCTTVFPTCVDYFPLFHLCRWFRPSSAQLVPVAVPHGVRCGVWGLHLVVRHTAGASFRPGVQHPLPHPQRPYLVTGTLF